MLADLNGRASERKLRLFACFCYRRFHEYLNSDEDSDGLFAVDLAEAYADGLATPADLAEVREEIVAGLWDHCSSAVVRHQIAELATAVPLGDVTPAANAFIFWVESNVSSEEVEGEVRPEHAAMCEVLRDLIGNPFRPVSLDPAWQTSTVVALAHAVYDNRALPVGTLDHARLDILADALEEVGCTDQSILEHLRGPGPHVRGCWPVDLVLANE
jgi:hypothetical protein